jgi:hypothetical protein
MGALELNDLMLRYGFTSPEQMRLFYRLILEGLGSGRLRLPLEVIAHV